MVTFLAGASLSRRSGPAKADPRATRQSRPTPDTSLDSFDPCSPCGSRVQATHAAPTCGEPSRPRHQPPPQFAFPRYTHRSVFRVPHFPFRISPVYAPFYLALPSWHPEKKLRPLSPNDLQRFPPEYTAHPRTIRCRVGRGRHPERIATNKDLHP